MIRREELLEIGSTGKPHGLKGEISFATDYDLFDESRQQFLVFDLDGIYVPFVLESFRYKSDDSGFLKLKGIDSDAEVKSLMNKKIFFTISAMQGDDWERGERALDYFIGFTLLDKETGVIGEIVDVNNETENVLFVVQRPDDSEILIPASDDWVVDVDEDKLILEMDIPMGLLDL